MIALVPLLVLAVVSLIITRVATMALAATGLSYDVARFQARSALSGVGYTTSESEMIANRQRGREPCRSEDQTCQQSLPHKSPPLAFKGVVQADYRQASDSMDWDLWTKERFDDLNRCTCFSLVRAARRFHPSVNRSRRV